MRTLVCRLPVLYSVSSAATLFCRPAGEKGFVNQIKIKPMPFNQIQSTIPRSDIIIIIIIITHYGVLYIVYVPPSHPSRQAFLLWLGIELSRNELEKQGGPPPPPVSTGMRTAYSILSPLGSGSGGNNYSTVYIV